MFHCHFHSDLRVHHGQVVDNGWPNHQISPHHCQQQWNQLAHFVLATLDQAYCFGNKSSISTNLMGTREEHCNYIIARAVSFLVDNM